MGRVVTDSAVTTDSPPAGFRGFFTGSGTIYFAADTAWLCGNRCDGLSYGQTSWSASVTRQAGSDTFARIHCLTTVPLLSFSRSASRTVFGAPAPGPSASPADGWALLSGGKVRADGAGLHADAAKGDSLAWTLAADKEESSFAPTPDPPSPLLSLRRAFRNYRYLRIRLTSPAAGPVTLTIRSRFLTLYSGFGTSYVNARRETHTLAVAAGANVLTVDMIQGTPDPWGVMDLHGSFVSARNKGVAPGWVSVDEGAGEGPFPFGAFDNVGDWLLPLDPDHDAASLTLSGLAAGEYVVAEITAYDRADGMRTPLRVAGDPVPAATGAVVVNARTYPDGFASVPHIGPPAAPAPVVSLRVLVNGRLLAGVPAPYRVADRAGDGGQVTVTGADFAAQWAAQVDGGCGAWSVTQLDADILAAVSASSLSAVPGSVSQAGFDLRADFPACIFQYDGGFDVTVGTHLTVRWDLGAQAEGIVVTENSFRPAPGATAKSSVQTPPPGDSLTYGGATVAYTGPTPEVSAAADDDGYFALPGLRQPVAFDVRLPGYDTDRVPTDWQRYVSVPHTIQSGDDATVTFAQVIPHRNLSYLYVAGAIIKVKLGGVANLAHRGGPYFEVRQRRDAATGGPLGLGLWRRDTGAPTGPGGTGPAWDLMASPVTNDPGDSQPSVDRDGRGRLMVAFTRTAADGSTQVMQALTDDDGGTFSDPA